LKSLFNMEVFTETGRKKTILKALIEYENNHYNSEDKKWQNAINVLIDEFR